MDFLEIEQTYEEFNKLSVLLNKLEQSGLDDSSIIVSLNSLNSFQLRFQGVAATTFVLNDLTIVYRKKNVK